MDWENIREIMPQTYPFLFIDKVMNIIPGKMVRCRKNVSYNEWFFNGHFPDNPVMPGVLISEAAAQSAVLLYLSFCKSTADDIEILLKKIEFEYLKKVKPGDCLEIQIQAIKLTSIGGIVRAECFVENECVAKGNIVFGVIKK